MGDEALEAWRAGGAADDGATWRQNVEGRGRGDDPRRGAAGKIQQRRPTAGQAQTGGPKRGAASKNLAASAQRERSNRPNTAASAKRKWLKQRTNPIKPKGLSQQ